jgi:uncharacterized protein (DUF1330 family)
MAMNDDSPTPGGITFGFYGNAPNAALAGVRAFEDDVLSLLADHGAKLQFRGHRSADQPEDLPAEFHVIWFPSDEAFDAYLHDPRRSYFLQRHGEVFTSKVIVRLDTITT